MGQLGRVSFHLEAVSAENGLEGFKVALKIKSDLLNSAACLLGQSVGL